MPTPTKGPRLGGGPAHERLMLANLATSLFEHDRITTTEAKAKRLRPLAERLITFAKRGDLHARRQVMTVIRDKDVVHKLFAEIGPKFAERPGGYTRIIKTNPRKGDNAPMAVIELVEEYQSVGRGGRAGPRHQGGAKKAPTGRTNEIAEDAAAESRDRGGGRGRRRGRGRGRRRRGSTEVAADEASPRLATTRRPGRDRPQLTTTPRLPPRPPRPPSRRARGRRARRPRSRPTEE